MTLNKKTYGNIVGKEKKKNRQSSLPTIFSTVSKIFRLFVPFPNLSSAVAFDLEECKCLVVRERVNPLPDKILLSLVQIQSICRRQVEYYSTHYFYFIYFYIYFIG